MPAHDRPARNAEACPAGLALRRRSHFHEEAAPAELGRYRRRCRRLGRAVRSRHSGPPRRPVSGRRGFATPRSCSPPTAAPTIPKTISCFWPATRSASSISATLTWSISMRFSASIMSNTACGKSWRPARCRSCSAETIRCTSPASRFRHRTAGHIVHIDAHLDYVDERFGVRHGQGNPLRRAAECDHVTGITHLGIRNLGSSAQSDSPTPGPPSPTSSRCGISANSASPG